MLVRLNPARTKVSGEGPFHRPRSSHVSSGQLVEPEALLVVATSTLDRLCPDAVNSDGFEAVSRESADAARHVTQPASWLSSSLFHAEFQRQQRENERGFSVFKTCHYRCILLHRSAFIRSIAKGSGFEKALIL